jgi:hypothetical protein
MTKSEGLNQLGPLVSSGVDTMTSNNGKNRSAVLSQQQLAGCSDISDLEQKLLDSDSETMEIL